MEYVDPYPPEILARLVKLPHTNRLTLTFLGHHSRIRAAFRTAHVEAYHLRTRLQQLELQMRQATFLLESDGTPFVWPPVRGPIRPPTLHMAMAIVLDAHDNEWTRIGDIAMQIKARALYQRRDGFAATPRDVSARASNYPHLFQRDGALIRVRPSQFERLFPSRTAPLRHFPEPDPARPTPHPA